MYKNLSSKDDNLKKQKSYHFLQVKENPNFGQMLLRHHDHCAVVVEAFGVLKHEHFFQQQ